MNRVPELESERLLLRGHRRDDLGDALAMWSDPTVTRFIGGKPSTEAQTWARLSSYVGHWALMDYGYWVVVEKATGRYIGEVGFADFRRDIEATMKAVPELGWALAAHAHGKGYGTEAVRTAVGWGDEHLPSDRTVCLIDVENVASIRVALACGFREFARATFGQRPVAYFQRSANRSRPSRA